jgi:hypothetical protein
MKNMSIVNFNSENVQVDWFGLNISGAFNIKKMTKYLFEKGFNCFIFFNDEPKYSYCCFKNNHKVYLREYNTSQWVGIRLIFSGNNAKYFYERLRTGKFNLNKLNVNKNSIKIGRLDLVFVQKNLCLDTNLFDLFLLDCRSHILKTTFTKHVKLYDYPDGKMLKVNRRNNSNHYRIYQHQNDIRFELELKNRSMRVVEELLFSEQFVGFEHKLTLDFFKYSLKILNLKYEYTHWLLNFNRKYAFSLTPDRPLLLTSYLQNSNKNREERRLLHLLQFLSFIHFKNRLKALDLSQECKIKDKIYYLIKFPLINFTKFIGFEILKQSHRNKILDYFKQFQTLDPICVDFRDGSFKSFVIFPYVETYKDSYTNLWCIEILMCHDLLHMSYPIHLSNEFLLGKNKNDIRLKMWLIRGLATNSLTKILFFDEFLNKLNVQNKQLVELKKNFLHLLTILINEDLIEDDIKIAFKSGRIKETKISNLLVSDVTRRILQVSLKEKFKF